VSEVKSSSGWVGWIGFAGIILILSGAFSAIQGLVAIIGPGAYFVVSDGTLFLLDVTGWGWWSLIIGLLLALTGFALLSGATWARVVAIILASLSAIGQLLLIPAQPWWALIIIAVDILIIYAVSAHGKEIAAAD
jgi:hypothetical protein